MKHQVVLRIFALSLAAAPFSVLAQTAAPKPDYTLWETVSKIERYGPRDRTPAKVDRRTSKQCLAAREQTADQLMQQEEMMRKLKGKCWVADKREDDNRTQVKWACKDGMTAEVATRTEPPNKLGYMMVFNIPNEGALSITAESMKVADTCVPEKSPPPTQPVPPAPPNAAGKGK